MCLGCTQMHENQQIIALAEGVELVPAAGRDLSLTMLDVAPD